MSPAVPTENVDFGRFYRRTLCDAQTAISELLCKGPIETLGEVFYLRGQYFAYGDAIQRFDEVRRRERQFDEEEEPEL